jgi:formate dehydrogenase iron-sulfur subunit
MIDGGAPQVRVPLPMWQQGGTRMGFFTDTSICIGCKACEVACKEWNGVPDTDASWSGNSYDNTMALGANSWRHVAFVERPRPDTGDGVQWLMSSDVCKHCTQAACLEVCPTGAIFRSEYGTVVVQDDICIGCGYCVSACPFGVLERRQDDGRAFKCTLCYDRLKVGEQPACAKACPTASIQFGPLEELKERAQQRLEVVRAEPNNHGARLYGADSSDGVGGFGAFFLLLDEPETYGLPPAPSYRRSDLVVMWGAASVAAAVLVGGIAGAFGLRRQ